MKHLNPHEFIDLAEGVRAEIDMPHLATCAACRRQLADLRADLSSLSAAEMHAGTDVPEPSPLFWDHFSARVREAVAAEGSPRRGRWALSGAWGRPWWSGAVPVAGALALIAVAVVLTTYVRAPVAPEPPASAAIAVVTDEASLAPFGATDDPVLSLIADLMADLDLAEASAALLPSPAPAGDADDVVSTLTADERVELQRLLQEELAKPRA